ncbi:MAG: epoxyqueuosine reductase [Bacilli bacterium]
MLKRSLIKKHPYTGVIAKETYSLFASLPQYPQIKSIIVCLFPYSNRTKQGSFLPAKMFYGTDYHIVVTKKLEEFVKEWELPDAIVGVDVSPLDERRCAYLAGLGTLGDNNLIINPVLGTYFAIGTIMTSALFDAYDSPINELCTHCGACLSVCPTHALDGGFQKNRCISHLSQKNSQDFSLYDFMKINCYGCDLCQDVCFYNFHPDYSLPELAWDELSAVSFSEMLALDNQSYQEKYQMKSWNWIGYERMLRNLMVLKNQQEPLTNEENALLATKSNKQWFLNHLQYLRGHHGN